ncbi:DUF1294 domain-containing protein [Aquitalea magnusonii]|uniref:Uncharacterized membrane protein YsdA (DUF1294 family) n=1 Tax=Aquitalea magnusonii TaxID=332411 RepID=A0A318JH49_9NEIS|nr:DUF1294 domain-containing protein [Aquitalea magnusonii]PXX49899.1 uncharacterized membrane protein YsdA (DUF1294 family) [Aquitalea magnusonii]
MSLPRPLANLLALPPLLAAGSFALTDSLFWPLLLYFGMSVLTFALYGWDKRQAVHHGRRTPEKLLHWLELLGGWPGGLLGQYWLQHKSSKRSYQLMFWLIVLAHWLAWGGWIAWLWHVAHPV